MAGKDKIMKILAIARYDEEPVVQEINNTLEDMQRYVMGYIETVTLSETAMLVCNEEGKLIYSKQNLENWQQPGCNPWGFLYLRMVRR